MDYTSFCIILGIMFWVLIALGIVCLIIATFICYEEYKWKKEDRDYDELIAHVNDIVNDILNQLNDSDSGGNEQSQN